ncbi:MAG: photosynthetic reaction center subunit M, partial [Chloroflexi bacterium]
MATMDMMPGDLELGRDRGRIGKPIEIPLLENFGFDSQLGPFYLGFWNAVAYISGGIFTFIWLFVMLSQVNFNPVAFIKYFVVLQIDPPSSRYGLSFPPLNEGGWWLIATFFL